MTSHELARQLLSGPDRPILVNDGGTLRGPTVHTTEQILDHAAFTDAWESEPEEEGESFNERFARFSQRFPSGLVTVL